VLRTGLVDDEIDMTELPACMINSSQFNSGSMVWANLTIADDSQPARPDRQCEVAGPG
jgi:hypothetical protein